MEERGYVAEALFGRLRERGIAFRLVGDASGYPERAPLEVELAVPGKDLRAVPALVARFALDFDLRLVGLERPQPRAWRAALAWSDELGRPRFLRVRLFDERPGRWLPWRAPGPPSVLFTGRETPLRSHLMTHVRGQLAPLGLRMVEERAGTPARGEFRVVFEAPAGTPAPDDALLLGRGEPLPALITQTVAAILGWLELRVERRYPDAVVGHNPWQARVLQAFPMTGFLFHSSLASRPRSPLLMPHPYGIVIEKGVEIGRRVTVMHQVTIGRKDPSPGEAREGGVPCIGDNVYIGPGAKVLGPVRVGRGATVGANAVVTRDVPSHCTVVGANRILGAAASSVADARREKEQTVVNT